MGVVPMETIEKKPTYIKNVRELRVYQEAFAISLEIHKATLEFPKIEQYALGDQMRRASKSICANLAEGFSRQAASKTEFKRFVQIALGSSEEMAVWVEYAQALGYVNEETTKEWITRYSHISRMLHNLKNK